MIINTTDKVGADVLRESGCVVIGLSIRNSYFTEDALKQLLAWSNDNFQHIYIMIPDKPAIHTLQALGYEFKKAKEKAMLASNNLENKCNRIIEQLTANDRFKIIRWDYIEANSSYVAALEQLTKLYSSNKQFQHDARSATQEVLKHNTDSILAAEAIEIGVQFLLMELAFIAHAADVLDQPHTAYIYHKEMPILENLLSGKYNLKAPGNAGYIIAKTQL